MKSTAIFLSALALAGHACAIEIAAKYQCLGSANAEHLVKSFQERGLIEAKPYSVSDSISYYAVKPGYTAFGLPLVALSAYQEGTKFFARGPGTSPGNRFGLIVQASQGALRAAASKQGTKMSNPRLQQYPQVSVDWFEGDVDGSEPPPPNADPRFKYAQLVCQMGFN